jgi:hypothetical protein
MDSSFRWNDDFSINCRRLNVSFSRLTLQCRGARENDPDKLNGHLRKHRAHIKPIPLSHKEIRKLGSHASQKCLTKLLELPILLHANKSLIMLKSSMFYQSF